jgi:uncharacterized protein YjbJ (UPF0337 family)
MARDRDMRRSGREDQIRGRVEELKGKVRGDVGDAVDNRSEHVKGRTEELKGKARKKFGELKESLGSRDRESDVEDRGDIERSSPSSSRSRDV